MDKVVIEYEINVKEAEQAVEGIKEKTKEAGDTSKKASKETTDSFKDQEKSMGAISSLVDRVFPIKMVQSYAKETRAASQGMLGLAGATTTSNAATKAGTKGWKMFRIALLSTGIGAIVILLGSLVAWLQRTTEGADFMARSTAFVGEIFDSLGGVLARVGGMFVRLFQDPVGSLKAFGQLIVTNITNRIMGIINLIPNLAKAVKQLFAGEFAEAGKTATNALVQAGTGIDNITDRASKAGKALGGMAKEINEAANEAANLAQMTRELDREMQKYAVTQSENSLAIAKALDMSRDENISIERRNEALKEAAALKDAEMKQVEAFARRRLEIAQRDAAINDNEDKAREELEAATIAFHDIQTKQFNERRSLRRHEERLVNEQARAQREINEREQEALQTIAELQADSIEKRIEAIRSGMELQLQQEGLFQSERKAIIMQAEAEIAELVEEQAQKELEIASRKLDAELKMMELRTQTIEEQIDFEMAKREQALSDTELLEEERQAIITESEQKIENIRQSARDRIRDAELGMIQLKAETVEQEIELERMKLERQLEDETLYLEERELLIAEHEQRISDLKEQKIEEERQKRQELQNDIVAMTSEAAHTAMQLMDNRAQHELQAIDRMLENETISQEQADARRKQIQREQAERARTLAIFEAVIATSRAVAQALPNVPMSAIVGALGAAQVAAIATQPMPAFRDGAIDIKGKGTGRSDSNLARISKGESVINANATKRNKQLLSDINAGRDVTYSSLVAPEKRKETEAGGMMFDDSDIIRELRNNKSISISNFKQMARVQAKEQYKHSYRQNKYV